MSCEFLIKASKFLITSGANAKTTGAIIGFLSPEFAKENYVVPRRNIEEFIKNCVVQLSSKDLPVVDMGCGRRSHKDIVEQTLEISTSGQYMALDHFIGNDEQYRRSGPNVLGSVSRTPLLSDSIGCVICTEVLEHVPNDDDVLTEIHRVLRPGGKLFLTLPGKHIPKHEKRPYQKDYRRYSTEDIKLKLVSCGFQNIEVFDKSLYEMQINIFVTATKI